MNRRTFLAHAASTAASIWGLLCGCVVPRGRPEWKTIPDPRPRLDHAPYRHRTEQIPPGSALRLPNDGRYEYDRKLDVMSLEEMEREWERLRAENEALAREARRLAEKCAALRTRR